MKILYASDFGKQFDLLPNEIKNLYRRQEALFQENWHDPRLHAKKLKNHTLGYSFRITIRYRVLFLFVEDGVALFSSVGHRKDSYA